MSKKLPRTIALEQEEWDALKEMADANRRPMNAELGLIILAERDRRAAASNEE